MVRLDLESLDVCLAEARYERHRQALLDVLTEHPGPYAWERLRATPWQALVVRTPESGRLHAVTRRRLENGDPLDGESLRRGFAPSMLDVHAGDLRSVLSAIRTEALGLESGFRRADCHAPAGYTKKVAVFPPPGAIDGAIRQLGEFHEARPFASPVWNALLLYVLLLRVHPYADGNGRTMRVLLSFLLWREGLISDSVLPLKRALDANRASEMKRFVEISRWQGDADRFPRALANALAFVAQVFAHAAMAASDSKCGADEEEGWPGRVAS